MPELKRSGSTDTRSGCGTKHSCVNNLTQTSASKSKSINKKQKKKLKQLVNGHNLPNQRKKEEKKYLIHKQKIYNKVH